jgi:hypothetical protein
VQPFELRIGGVLTTICAAHKISRLGARPAICYRGSAARRSACTGSTWRIETRTPGLNMAVIYLYVEKYRIILIRWIKRNELHSQNLSLLERLLAKP